MREGKNGGKLKTGGNNGGGRPPKLISTLIKDLKEQGYERATSTTITEAIEYLINLPLQEIEDILDDKEQPLSLRIIARQLKSNKGFEALEVVLSRAQGRPKQQMDVQQTNMQPVEVRVKITKDDLRSDPIE